MEEMEGWRLNKCSTSTTTTTTDAVKKLKRKKKTSVKKEIKKLSKSFKREAGPPAKKMKILSMEFADTVNENLPTKKNNEEPKGKEKWIRLCVKGFDSSLPMAAIETALANHFASCGVINQVMVPDKCRLPGASNSKGFAHISMTTSDEEKALALDGSLLGGQRLEVRRGIFGPPYNRQCQTCPIFRMEGKMEGFLNFRSWEIGQIFERKRNNGAINLEEAEQSVNHT